MRFLLFLIVLLAVLVNVEGGECRTDSDCSSNKLCVNGDCLSSNHPSGDVVITDQNKDDPCTPDCPQGKKCTAGICVHNALI